MSADCRRVLAVLGNGFIFRYQYTKPEPEGRLDDGQEGKAGHRGEGDSGYAAREELNENRDCDAAMQPPPIVPREDVSVIHRDLSPE